MDKENTPSRTTSFFQKRNCGLFKFEEGGTNRCSAKERSEPCCEESTESERRSKISQTIISLSFYIELLR